MFSYHFRCFLHHFSLYYFIYHPSCCKKCCKFAHRIIPSGLHINTRHIANSFASDKKHEQFKVRCRIGINIIPKSKYYSNYSVARNIHQSSIENSQFLFAIPIQPVMSFEHFLDINNQQSCFIEFI